MLLLTLTVEVRRNQLHRTSRRRLFVFFLLFGLVETAMVLSIDGHIYPFQLFDGVSALIIFGLMGLLFRLSMSDPAD